ncbi:MAG: nitrite reductase large subunit, partial [Chromatiales bacterium]|nr:nitrite reductase large subunit [Chromatiales bacterium]
VGGNGGIKVRVTDLLTRVSTPEEVLEYCAAYIQFYRETAHYLERTAPWIERIGLTAVKETLVDNPEKRKNYAERFMKSQEFAQIDPWTERAQGAEEGEFQPLARLAG